VDGGRGEVRLRVLMYRGDPEDGGSAIRLPHIDLIARVQLAQPVEDSRAAVGIDVPGDDRGADLARPRATGIPAGHGGAAWHLQPGRAVSCVPAWLSLGGRCGRGRPHQRACRATALLRRSRIAAAAATSSPPASPASPASQGSGEGAGPGAVPPRPVAGPPWG